MTHIDLTRALNRMPDQFTSNQFSKVAKRYGLTDFDIRHGKVAKFLHQHCSHIGLRTWVKREKAAEAITDEMAIMHLKATGKYKIQALTQTWTEI